ncbi:MAG: Ldh family oxidoreductase [Acidobacteria bacterium]|nr:Ldh family oxidoreductase [Acidobacteriota bacterium]MCI0721390.1 Ldh family oxidoreductase [Acidobacteriota bacterium]
MSHYPGTERERRIPWKVLQTTVAGIFQACSMSGEDAGLLAETLVQADLRGCHSHGVLRVPEYVLKLKEGGVDPAGKPLVAHDAKAASVVDGGNSMGQIASSFAMREAIRRAREYNLALAAVRGSNHCGAMAYYAMLALPEDMIGIAATNALPTMAPWGGVDKILGINPLAVAIPAGQEDPIVLDAAFSGSSHGKIRVYHQKGESIPSDWAFDADGRPTTDPAEAITGLLQPIGGYKGTGLALVTGILSTLLSGASYGTELGNMVDGPQPGRDGHFYLAVKISAFVDLSEFKGRVDGIIRQIRNGRKAPNLDRIYAPGGLEAETERRYRREGIPLNGATLEGISRSAEALGVDGSAIRGESPVEMR